MPENSNSGIIRKIVLSAALGSIVVILTLSGFGFVPWLAGASLTILHIPVILAAVLQGYTSALIVGAVFGISSLIMAAIRPAPGSFDFLFVNPLISILPRLVFAFLAALIAQLYQIRGHTQHDWLSLRITEAAVKLHYTRIAIFVDHQSGI